MPAIAALLTLLLPAGAAAAELSIAPTGDPTFPDRAYVLQIDPPVALDNGDVEVRENGAPVRGLRVSSASAGDAGEFASVLVIDTSRSMRGEAIREAMAAARAFAAHRAPNQEVGAIAFSGSHRLLLPLSTDDGEIEDALAAPPRLGDGTHLYDAVSAAVGLLENEGVAAGSVVVLSDGADTGSEAAEADVVRQATQAGVRIFLVGLESERFAPGTLQGLAQAGEYTAANDPRQLEPIFSRFGAERASEHLIRYRSGAGIAQHVRVEVRVKGLSGAAFTSYETPGGKPTVAAHPTSKGFWGTRTAMLVTGLVIALLLAVAVFTLARPHRESVVERLARLGVFAAASRGQDGEGVTRSAAGGPLAAIEDRLAEREAWDRFDERLEVAGIEIPPIEVLAGTVLATLVAFVVVAAVAPFALMAGLALLLPVGVHAAIERKLRLARERFAEDLADNLQVIASAIRAGHSMVGALAVVAEEATGPAQTEFRRIVAAERVGVPLEDSIRESARRMENRDMEQLALVAIIQRETGGNTAEIIDRAVETIRERAELRRMMASLTAQGRLSRAIVTALPVFLLIALSAINPEYVAPLFNTTGGQVMLAVGALMVLTGSLVIKRIVEMRV